MEWRSGVLLRVKAGVQGRGSCVSEGGQIASGCISGSAEGSKVKTDNVLPVNHSDLLRELQAQRHVRVGDLDVCGSEGSLSRSFGG